jgi:hypothetical protein
MRPDEPLNYRRFQLPGGRIIQILGPAPSGRLIQILGPADEQWPAADGSVEYAPAKAPSPAAGTGVGLHACPACEGRLVYPLDWHEAGSSHWEVSLRCPECEWRDTGKFSQAVVEQFDIELDRGAGELLRDLQHLAYANMVNEIERFVCALEADGIVPSDF